jgi:hypothetical protein
MDPSHLQEDKECNRPPCLPRPPPTAIHIGIRARILLLYIQKGRAIHIGSPILNKQIRHDNQPADLNAFSFSSSFPWRWHPLSSTDTPLALAILAAVYCCCCMLIIATWLCCNSLQLPPARVPAIVTIPFFPAGTPLSIVKHT